MKFKRSLWSIPSTLSAASRAFSTPNLTKAALFLLPLSASLMATRASAQTAPPETLTRNITNGTTTLTANFQRHSNRSSQFMVYTQGADGALTSAGVSTYRTYLGTVSGRPGALATGWLKPDGTFYSKIIFEDGTSWNSTGGTATATGNANWTPAYPGFLVPAGGAGSSVKSAQLGVDANNAYYVACGSNVENTVAAIEWSVMKANAVYLRDAAIIHHIGRIIIRSTQAVDPYIGNPLLDTVRDQWNNVLPASGHDIATVVDPGSTGSGLAWVGQIGTTYRYSYAGSSAQGDFEGTWRHEAGHNWGANHYEGNTPEGATIMSGNALARFSSTELARIIAHRNTRTVLDNLGAYSYPLPPRANADRASAAWTTTTITWDVLNNDSDSNGQALTLLSFDATSAQGGTLTRSVGTGPGGRDRIIYTMPANLAALDHFNYRIQDSAGQQAVAKCYIAPPPPIPQLFQHGTYGGWGVRFNVGTYTQAQLVAAGAADNDASSIKVPNGFKVTLYENGDFTGNSVVLTGDDTFFDTFNDQASSLKVETFAAEFYEHGAYGGWKGTLGLGTYTQAQMVTAGVPNNGVSSIKVPAGMKVTLYADDNCTGTSLVKTADDSDFGDDSFHDVTSSIKVELAP